MDDRRLAVDDERFAAFQEIERHVGKRLGPFGADRVPCVIDEHQVTVGQQCLVATAHLRRDHVVERAEQHQCRRLHGAHARFEFGVAVGSAQA